MSPNSPVLPSPARAPLLLSLLMAASCGDVSVEPLPPAATGTVHELADGCFAVHATKPSGRGGRLLRRGSEGVTFELRGTVLDEAAVFRLQPADLGSVVFYDREAHYLVSDDDETLARLEELVSENVTNDDTTDPGAVWNLEPSPHDPMGFQVQHDRSGRYLGMRRLVDDPADAAIVHFIEREGCLDYPELTLDAEGTVSPTTFDDGSLFGIVDTHSHIMSNFSFGGGLFHGSPFHPLGVEHALNDCDVRHGVEGRKDLFGWVYDDDSGELDQEVLISTLISGNTPDANHVTAGYPDFTEWPHAGRRATHQQQYWRWLERAWLGGLRLMVQHATSNEVICELVVGAGVQDQRYSCEDMTAVDRIIEETYALERYIDAQYGGPGEGFFRIVASPAEARDVIAEGKLAIVLGIETSNLFECKLTPDGDDETCDEAYVEAQLDRYRELGVRVLFPVHKFDNAFSAGDGNRSFIELGNIIQTGHWANFVLEGCPDVPAVFDQGDLQFGGVNMPREDYDAPPPIDMSEFFDNPIAALAPLLDPISNGERLVGNYCQNHGLTPLGEHLITEMMKRGMILEVDHLPRRSYERAFEMLEAADYPAAGTHGSNFGGRIYALGGVSKSGFGRCHDPDNPGTVDDGYQARIQLIRDNGGFPAEGFGFDLNGFAGARGPRFGERGCGSEQTNPVTYPFTAYAGDVTFTEPRVGNRMIDFNTEGFVHIGMLPELIQDIRLDGVTDEDLEPLFKSAEGYIRMWEKAEARAAELR